LLLHIWRYNQITNNCQDFLLIGEFLILPMSNFMKNILDVDLNISIFSDNNYESRFGRIQAFFTSLGGWNDD